MNTRPNPYVGPRSFQPGEPFYGRDRELRSLSALLIAERIVLLHSPSGAGKSSLVQAGLLPRLIDEEFNILPTIRLNQEPPAEIASLPGINRYALSAMLSMDEGVPESGRLPLKELAALTLDDYLTRRFRAENAPASDVLVFDQFEEVLTIAPADRESKLVFFEQLGLALRNKQRWALFAIREDYLGALAPYTRPIPGRFAATFRLDLLGVDGALQAIRKPPYSQGVEFKADAAQKLVDDLRRIQVQLPDGSLEEQLGQYVEPVQLQVVCLRLWQGLEDSANAVDEADLAGVGDVNQSLADYYAASVKNAAEKSSVGERGIREWFDRKMITPDGIRGQVLMGAESSDGLPNAVVHLLEDAHIIRGEKRAGKTWYELSHDRMLKPVRENNTTWFEQNLSLFQRQAVLWNQQGRSDGLLLRGKEFQQAENEILSLQLTGDEKDFLEACRKLREREQRDMRQRQFIITGLVASLALLAVAIFFGLSANAARIEANQEKANAQAASTQAVNNANAAATAQAEAEAQKIIAEKRSEVALARQLAAQAQSINANWNSKQMIAVLLAVQSIHLTPSSEAVQILLNNNFAAHPIARMAHDSRVNSVAFSPDGTYVVSGSMDKTARVWQALTGKEIARMTHEAAVNFVAFSPDGKYVVSGSADNSLRVWEALTGKEITRMAHDASVNFVAFSPDGKYVLSGSADKTARVWEALTGVEIARMTHEGAVTAIAFSPNGRYAASGSADKTARVWEALTGVEIARINHDGAVASVAFSPDTSSGAGGKYVVSGSLDNTARVWETSTGKEIARMTHEAGVYAVAFSPDTPSSPGGTYVISAGRDNTARLWEASTGKEITRMKHDNWVESVSFSPDGKYVAVGCYDKTARVWEVSTGREIARMTHDDTFFMPVAFSPSIPSGTGGKYMVVSANADKTVRVWLADAGNKITRITHGGGVNAVAFSPDILSSAGTPAGEGGKYVVSASADKTARVWDAATGAEIARMVHDDSLSSIAFSPDRKYVVSSSRDKTVRVWDALTGAEIARMTHDNRVYAAVFSANPLGMGGKYAVASVSADRTARVWDAATGVEIARMTYDNLVRTVAISPNGQYVLSGGCDELDERGGCIQGSARVWEALTGKEISRMVHDGVVYSVAFSPDGKYAVSGSYDRTARVWDVMTGKEISRMVHTNLVNVVAFSPDGQRVLSGSYDNTARVWEALTGKEIARMTHDDWVYTAAFSPDGKYVVSAGVDNTARVWESETGKEVARMIHDGDVSSVAFSPDGRYVASGSADKTARIWAWQVAELLDNACSVMPRNLTRAEWQQYIGDIPYQAVCPNLPVEPEPIPTPTP